VALIDLHVSTPYGADGSSMQLKQRMVFVNGILPADWDLFLLTAQKELDSFAETHLKHNCWRDSNGLSTATKAQCHCCGRGKTAQGMGFVFPGRIADNEADFKNAGFETIRLRNRAVWVPALAIVPLPHFF
jgi:hypothetical protein